MVYLVLDALNSFIYDNDLDIASFKKIWIQPIWKEY